MLKAVIEAYDNVLGWTKVATYTIENAKRYIDDPEYKKALIRSGYPENVELRIKDASEICEI